MLWDCFYPRGLSYNTTANSPDDQKLLFPDAQVSMHCLMDHGKPLYMLVITPRTSQACKMSILEGGERFATYVNITVVDENLSLMYPIKVLWVTPMGITPYNVGSPGG